jgi:hypothetical protein
MAVLVPARRQAEPRRLHHVRRAEGHDLTDAERLAGDGDERRQPHDGREEEIRLQRRRPQRAITRERREVIECSGDDRGVDDVTVDGVAVAG